MKLRSILVLALALVCQPVLAQVTPGTSPLSGPKGGTNNAFMQFAGPTAPIKTYTLPNASGTLAMLSQIQTWTGAQSFTAGGALSGTFSGTPTFSGTNFITNGNLAQAGAATLKGNPTASLANVQDFTVQGLSNLASPSATLDLIPIYNHTTGTIQNVTPGAIVGASAVASFNARTGAVVPASGDYTAPQINYTAPGTGGVAVPISQHLQKELWADEYGSVCNGSTDDHVAFQNMINEAQILGSTANFVGTCMLTTGLSITGAKGLIFQGTGWGSSQLNFTPGITALAVANTGSVTLRQ